MVLRPNRVICARSPYANYTATENISILPEFPEVKEITPALITFRALLRDSKLDYTNYGTSKWNPLGDLINEGEKVLIKPNWVHHENNSGRGLDCLVTNTTVIAAILNYVIKTRPASIIIGDAAIQGCNFAKLLVAGQVMEMVQHLRQDYPNLYVKDFRRTVLPEGRLGDLAIEECKPLNEYILFDLERQSNLEPIVDDGRFRVTMYDPDVLQRTHSKGKHLYLVAREVIEANVVINVPKLKTHKKACITGALKNMVGINGHKEYLPHHRKGGSSNGGDCYPGRSSIKGFVEDILDMTNRARNASVRCVLACFANLALKSNTLLGHDRNIEGSWYGNDTVWRMCLDLQQILHYGRIDGTLDDKIKRTVITVTDAIIAGEGEGPLAPTPVPFGMMTLGTSTAATDWVHARLMRYDSQAIPLIKEAFYLRQHPLVNFTPEEIIVEIDGQEVNTGDLVSNYSYPFRPPHGWQGHCELRSHASSNRGKSEPRYPPRRPVLPL